MKINEIYNAIIHNKNDHIKFLPLLFIYSIIILLFSSNKIFSDEWRYLTLAQNLLQGFYSPPPPNIDLWTGPGYPLLIAVFLNFGAGLTIIKLLNAVFFFYAVFFLYKSQILLNISENKALLFSYFLALAFPHIFVYLQRVYTEISGIFLVSVFMYSCLNTVKNNRKIDIILSGFLLGYLVLTKIIFAYVVLIILLSMVLIRLIYKYQISTTNRLLFIIISSFIFTTPYMMYTYSLTGKIYYPGNSGGSSLYWMSSPHKNEYGDWKRAGFILNNNKFEYDQIKEDDYYLYMILMARDSALQKNHASFFNEISTLNPIERDEALKKRAIENILRIGLRILPEFYSIILYHMKVRN